MLGGESAKVVRVAYILRGGGWGGVMPVSPLWSFPRGAILPPALHLNFLGMDGPLGTPFNFKCEKLNMRGGERCRILSPHLGKEGLGGGGCGGRDCSLRTASFGVGLGV